MSRRARPTKPKKRSPGRNCRRVFGSIRSRCCCRAKSCATERNDMTRYDCLKILAPLLKDEDLVVTALGWVAGEWHSVRPKESNLYQINMRMCTPLSLGL